LTFSDDALIEETRGGSRLAFDQLMQRYQRLVFRVSYTFARQPEDALDITQEVFLKAYKNLGAYQGRGTFKSWLLRITHNQAIDWLRKHKRHRGHGELTLDNIPEVAATQESELYMHEQRKILMSEMEGLNPKQRLAVSLRYFEEMPIRDIAEVLECSQGVVKSILFRSVEKLRNRVALQRG
jgi:RNA polymerase sigma-70 factor (ECF subfamily)